MSKSYQYTFTVFTATFNRAHTLHRVYESLKAQTFRNFEWLIIDDGSTDNTRKIVEDWRQQSGFSIRYIWQNNQGKHNAFNRGVQEAKGKLFLNFDSDDACEPIALERLNYHWESIPADKRDQFSAVTSLCKDQNGRIIGNKFPKNIFDSDSLEIFYKYKLKGDKWGFHRTDILSKFPFPPVEDVNFVPESIVWNAIAKKFKTRFVNEPLLICYKRENGRSDHLSNPRKPSKQSSAYLQCHYTILNNELIYFYHRPHRFLISSVQYIRYSFHTNAGVLKQIQNLDNLGAMLLGIMLLPCGFIVYLADKILRR